MTLFAKFKQLKGKNKLRNIEKLKIKNNLTFLSRGKIIKYLNKKIRR